MSKFCTSALILALAAMMSTAVAQEKKMVAQAEVIEVMLLRQKSVRTELKLDSAEDKKIYEFTYKQHEAAQEIHKLPESQQKERWEALHKENDEFLHKCLSAEQRKRLDQIGMQAAGLLVVSKPSIARELKLTPDQKQQVTKLQEGAREKIFDAFHSVKNEGRNEKLAELRRTNQQQLMKVLTDEQRTKWKEMAGAPFNGKLAFEETEKKSK